MAATTRITRLNRYKYYWPYFVVGGASAVVAGGVLCVPSLNIVAVGIAMAIVIAGSALVVAVLVAGLFLVALKMYDHFTNVKAVDVEVPVVLLEEVIEKTQKDSREQNEMMINKDESKTDFVVDIVHGKAIEVDKPKSQVSVLNSVGVFSSHVVTQVPLLSDGMVLLTDGSQVPKEKAEAVYHAIQSKVSDVKSAAAFALIHLACADYVKGIRTLRAQSKSLVKFRAQDEDYDNEYPIIRSDGTIDEETRRIILCCMRTVGNDIEIINPMLHAPTFKK